MNIEQLNTKTLAEINKLYKTRNITKDQLILMDLRRTDNNYQAFYKIDQEGLLFQVEYVFATNQFILRVYNRIIEVTDAVKEEKKVVKPAEKPVDKKKDSLSDEELINHLIEVLLKR